MEAIFHSFIKAFGWSIVHSIWQGAIIYAFLFLVLISVRRLSPSAKHNLAYLSTSALFIWFVATFVREWQMPVTSTAMVLSEYTPLLPASPTWSLSNIENIFPTITALYLGGLLIQSFILYKGYRVLQKLKRTQLETIPSEWEHICYRVIAKFNLTKRIDFHLSLLAPVPMVIGYFKPVILFPASLATSLDADQVEAILIHELAHIRRNDYLLNLIKTFMDTTLFFNPFVWLIGKYIKIEREHICDDMVLKFTGQPIKYAQTLLQIEMMKGTAPQTAMALSGKKQYLFDRIKRITTMKTKSMNVKQQLTGVTIIVAAILCLAWLTPAKIPVDKKDKNERVEHQNNSFLSHLNLNDVLNQADTIIPKEKKKEIKIIIKDSEGKEKQYNSLEEIPDSLKKDLGLRSKEVKVIKRQFSTDSLFRPEDVHIMREEIRESFNSPEFKKQMEEIGKNFNSPEFKKQMEEIGKNFNSPEFKKNMEEIKKNFNSPEFKRQIEDVRKSFNFPEFKKHQEEIILELKAFKEDQKDLNSHLDSDQFNKRGQKERIIYEKRILEYNKDKDLPDNKAYQKLKKKYEKDVEKLRKKQADAEMNKK